MSDQKKDTKENKKGFFARLLDKLDEKMAAKAKSGGCCCSSKDRKC